MGSIDSNSIDPKCTYSVAIKCGVISHPDVCSSQPGELTDPIPDLDRNNVVLGHKIQHEPFVCFVANCMEVSDSVCNSVYSFPPIPRW